MTDIDRIGVLFVCMGNICRSPLAEGVFLHQAGERRTLDRYRVDSAGTGGWHSGEPADPRSLAVAERHGIDLPSRARVVEPMSDFDEFPWLIAMDEANRADLVDFGAPERQIRLLRSFDPDLVDVPDHRREVPDPYYGGPDGFDRVFEMVVRACAGLHGALERAAKPED